MPYKRPEQTRIYQAPDMAAPEAPLRGSFRSRTYVLRPAHLLGGAIACITATLVLAGAAGYHIVRGDVMAEASAERTELVIQYQDRIDRLRTEIERLSSRQMVDRESVETQLMDVLRRQHDLSQRHTIVEDLVARAESVGIYLAGNQPVPLPKPPLDGGALAAVGPNDPSAIGGESAPIEDPVTALGLRSDARTATDPLAILQAPPAAAALSDVKKKLKNGLPSTP